MESHRACNRDLCCVYHYSSGFYERVVMELNLDECGTVSLRFYKVRIKDGSTLSIRICFYLNFIFHFQVDFGEMKFSFTKAKFNFYKSEIHFYKSEIQFYESEIQFYKREIQFYKSEIKL